MNKIDEEKRYIIRERLTCSLCLCKGHYSDYITLNFEKSIGDKLYNLYANRTANICSECVNKIQLEVF